MKLILSQYLRTLKERDEFDLLLPDLLLAMGYILISRPQTGNRQYGVDLAVVGKSPTSAQDELLLFVIKRGDIGRREWDSGIQSVRQSLNEVIEVYLDTHIEPSHQDYQKKIILATTGELKQDTQLNWDRYITQNAQKACFEFWGGDKVATLIEQHLLDEHIFNTEDRLNLRKALALSGDNDYKLYDLNKILLTQLGLNENGAIITKRKEKEIVKSLRTVHLATQIFAHWAEDEGNIKQALIASERALLWSWHTISHQETENKKKLYREISELCSSYLRVSHRYLDKLTPYFYVRDGLSGSCRESAELALVTFEQIGIISSIGLTQILFSKPDNESRQASLENAIIVADALINLLENNPVSGSPALDDHVIDIVLGLSLLTLTGQHDAAKKWLSNLTSRINYTFICRRNFPISTDSLDDLVEFVTFQKEEDKKRLSETSWIIPTLASWSTLLGHDDLYEALAKSSNEQYPEVCLQLWHPTVDYFNALYFKPAQYDYGETEAPIKLASSALQHKEKMQKLLSSDRHDVLTTSPAFEAGIFALDLMASRHFRTPIAPFIWYQIGGLTKQCTEINEVENIDAPN